LRLSRLKKLQKRLLIL